MKKIFSIAVAIIFTSLSISAQSLEDAVRFSFLNPITTARSMGTGNAIGPMGVDFGSFGSNPAGVGRMRYSEALVSIGVDYSSLQSQYQDGSNRPTSTNIKPTLNSAGMAFVNPGRRANWKQRNFALSINRLADFNQTINITDRTPGTITDRFVDISNGLFPSDLDIYEGNLAFNTFAIDTLVGAPTTYASFVSSASTVSKRIEQTTRGALNELQLTWGSNYNDKLFIGIGVGLRLLDYTRDKTHFEEDVDGTIFEFLDLTFTESLNSVGAGINVKAGVIYAVNRKLFISLAGQSPTWYTLTDNYSTSMEYAFSDNEVYSDNSPEGNFEYRFTSPWKFNGGVGMIIGQKGFLSGEIEYIDYTFNKYNIGINIDNSITQAQSDNANNDIDAELTSAVNIRVGGELMMDKFRFRGGVGLHSTPFSNSSEGSFSLSLGFGYRVNKFFADIGLRATFRDELYYPYFTFAPPQPIIDNQNMDLAAVVSIGTKF